MNSLKIRKILILGIILITISSFTSIGTVISNSPKVLYSSIEGLQENVSMPSGGATYLYLGATAGGASILPPSSLNLNLNVTVYNYYGQNVTGILIGHSYSNRSDFLSYAQYYLTGGVEVNSNNFTAYSSSTSSSTLAGSFNVINNRSLVVLLGASSGGYYQLLQSPLRVYNETNVSNTVGAVIAYGILNKGTYSYNLSFTETTNVPSQFSIGSVVYVFTPSPGPAPGKYYVTFEENGLPSGTPWSVYLNGIEKSNTTNTIQFIETNGTYPFSIPSVSKFNPKPSNGTITVEGSNVYEEIIFTAPPVKYNVTFTETGLPVNTLWNVTLNRVLESSATDSIIFSEINGTYSYSVSSINGYAASPSSGSITVNGASVNIAIIFSPPEKYTITFTESGLPAGTSWSVNLNGTVEYSSINVLTFQELNGSYSYFVYKVGNYLPVDNLTGMPLNVSTELYVSGSSINIPIDFQYVAPEYKITIYESGIPSNGVWGVGNQKLNIKNITSTSNEITIYLKNGTYTLNIYSKVQGYNPSQKTITITVDGKNITETATFTYSSPATSSFVTSPFDSLLTMLLIFIAMLGVLFLVKGRYGK